MSGNIILTIINAINAEIEQNNFKVHQNQIQIHFDKSELTELLGVIKVHFDVTCKADEINIQKTNGNIELVERILENIAFKCRIERVESDNGFLYVFKHHQDEIEQYSSEQDMFHVINEKLSIIKAKNDKYIADKEELQKQKVIENINVIKNFFTNLN